MKKKAMKLKELSALISTWKQREKQRNYTTEDPLNCSDCRALLQSCIHHGGPKAENKLEMPSQPDTFLC